MPQQQNKIGSITYLQIDSDSNYYNTEEQVRINGIATFTDSFAASTLSGSTQISGLFSGKRMTYDDVVYNSPSYATSSTSVDSSGNSRAILSLNIDYYASSSVDVYRQGAEIKNQKQWTAGTVKISAGTPGHLYHSNRYGISDLSIVDPDTYYEIEVFDPIKFVETGGDPEFFTYPIITNDSNQLENFILNGIIEPFPIRPVISNFSINFPFEPQAFRGDYGAGNLNHRFATEEVLSVDYFEPSKNNSQMFLDAVDYNASAISGSTAVGSYNGYLLLDENTVTAFKDVVPPRGYINSASYPNDLLNVVYSMLPGGTTYVSSKQKSATCGFVYNNAEQGTDSIAYGGLLY